LAEPLVQYLANYFNSVTSKFKVFYVNN